MKKKKYSLLRWPCLLQDVLNRRLLFKTKPANRSSTKGNHHPSFLRFWNWAEEKKTDAAKKLWRRRKCC